MIFTFYVLQFNKCPFKRISDIIIVHYICVKTTLFSSVFHHRSKCKVRKRHLGCIREGQGNLLFSIYLFSWVFIQVQLLPSVFILLLIDIVNYIVQMNWNE